MAKYYLKVNLEIKDNKRYINSYSLFKDNKLIKTFDRNTTREITRNIKNSNIDYIQIDQDYIVDDLDLIKKFYKIPSNKVSHFNTYVKIIAISSSISLANLISPINNEKTEETSIEIDNSDEAMSNNEINSSINNVTINLKDDDLSQNKSETYDYNSTYHFYYTDRSDYNFMNDIKQNYGDMIKRNAERYGFSENIGYAILAQENKSYEKRTDKNAGYGLFQVEYSVWNGYEINDNGETIIIDCDRMNYDPEYGIRIGFWILRHYYDRISINNDNNYYGYKLNDQECFAMTLYSYNKGETVVNDILFNNDNYSDIIDSIKSTGNGDDEYVIHVASYLEDGSVVSMIKYDGTPINITIDNLKVEKNKTI